ncbi:hypothetical protein Rumeso_03496 [Rubellimicrobium mesophilum DSM 19309]|uniref:Polysaccharide biosynthesis protein C-terminal domain-containing protein n=1 Tax=Rubellimicrobium mesophilum DSM 19309 TaxID=442562 RepID=A0A017HKT2_9RHOB|nr:oligosaccharide flippase family protein [Rubellimicrobium mesophilum]EYD74935.1 hypothetical protein Rumeso_03496 [Rubellimicrobium mesophilum DSM 19309]
MFWFVLPRLIAALLTFATMIMFSRMLGAVEFGHYNIVIVLGTMVHMYLFSWVNTSLARFYFAPEFKGELVASALGILTLLAAVLGTACIGLYVFGPEAGVTIAPVLIIVYGLTQMVHELAVTILRVLNLKRVYAVVVYFRPVVALALGAVLVLGGYGWVGAVGAASAGAGIAGLVILCRFTATRPRLPDLRTLRVLLSYGLPLTIVQSFELGLLLISQALLLFFSDAAAVGLFTAAHVLCFRSIRMLMTEVSKASSPEIFAAHEGEGKAHADIALSRYLSRLLLLSVPLTEVLILANDTIAHLLFRPEMAAGVAQQLPWLACAAFGFGLQGSFFSYAFTITRGTFRQLLVVCAATALHAAFTVLGAWLAGPLGVALATLATACSTLWLSVLVGREKYRVPYSKSELRKLLVGVLAFLPWGVAADYADLPALALALLVVGGIVGISALYLSGYEGMRRLKAPRHSP